MQLEDKIALAFREFLTTGATNEVDWAAAKVVEISMLAGESVGSDDDGYVLAIKNSLSLFRYQQQKLL